VESDDLHIKPPTVPEELYGITPQNVPESTEKGHYDITLKKESKKNNKKDDNGEDPSNQSEQSADKGPIKKREKLKKKVVVEDSDSDVLEPLRITESSYDFSPNNQIFREPEKSYSRIEDIEKKPEKQKSKESKSKLVETPYSTAPTNKSKDSKKRNESKKKILIVEDSPETKPLKKAESNYGYSPTNITDEPNNEQKKPNEKGKEKEKSKENQYSIIPTKNKNQAVEKKK